MHTTSHIESQVGNARCHGDAIRNVEPSRRGGDRCSLDFRERQRRTKLVNWRHDIAEVVAHPSTTLANEARAELALIVTGMVAEIAVLQKAFEGHESEFIGLIASTVGIETDTASALWNAHAVETIQTEGQRWSDHLRNERQRADNRFIHQHMADLKSESIGALLGLTRARIKAIFGTRRCHIVPVKARPDRFDGEIAERVAAFARDHCITAEHVGDMLKERGVEGLNAYALSRRDERDLLPKAGRAKESGQIGRAVAATAKAIGKSRSTVYARLAEDRAQVARDGLEHEIADFAEEMRITETEAHLTRVGMYEHRHLPAYPQRELVIAWFTDQTGKAPTDAQIRQWKRRGKWTTMMLEARAWDAGRDAAEIVEMASATDCETNSKAFRDAVRQKLKWKKEADRERKSGRAHGAKNTARDLSGSARNSHIKRGQPGERRDAVRSVWAGDRISESPVEAREAFAKAAGTATSERCGDAFEFSD
ncbi:hypothetical protein [Methylorubrum thiocyanatum]|uniref:hypothetical protein n=1 Tax=Methylorubrum thiocyanatum TaxID=47958 RepID=UPI0036621C34